MNSFDKIKDIVIKFEKVYSEENGVRRKLYKFIYDNKEKILEIKHKEDECPYVISFHQHRNFDDGSINLSCFCSVGLDLYQDAPPSVIGYIQEMRALKSYLNELS